MMAWTKRDLKRAYACNPELLAYLRERAGWTQAELGKVSGYSTRLISKAEAGLPICVQAVNDLADSLSLPEDPIYPEDLISDPVKMAQDYIAAEYLHLGHIVDAIRHFLDEEIVIHLPGDPGIIPFAGEHRGIAAVELAFEIFSSVMQVPENHDHLPCYQYLGKGNEVIVWGESWMHPIGLPLTKPLKLVHRMKYRRGKLFLVEVVFDSLEGSRLFSKMASREAENERTAPL